LPFPGISFTGNTATQDMVEETLHLTGMAYFRETDTLNETAAKMDKISWTRQPAEGFLARDLTVTSFFGFILGVQPGGLTIDVRRGPVSPVSTIGNSQDEISWMLSCGSFSSAAENAVFEQLFDIPSVSTEKLLTLASQQGIPIYTINHENINQILPYLSMPASYKQDISNSVQNYGYNVVVPKTGLQFNQWYGYCWQVIDLNTGAAGYYIAGGLSGGSMVSSAGGAMSLLCDLLWNSINNFCKDHLNDFLKGFLYCYLSGHLDYKKRCSEN
jgi:hypothetical protein